MSLPKETKIRILENFYAIDYILFGKPLKSLKLSESECGLCTKILVEEYLSTKGALLGTIIETYKLINHLPPKFENKITGKKISEMASKSAKIARTNASLLIKTKKGRDSVKNRLVETITEGENIDIQNEVETRIRERAYSLAIDNLLISRAINESENYIEMNSWMGRIIEDAYKILRSSLVETAMEIRNNIVNEAQKKNVIGPVKKGELELHGKGVEDTSEEHFKNLIKKDGWGEVSKRIIALKVWNKNKNPGLSSKMDKLQARLAKWVESQREKNPDFGG